MKKSIITLVAAAAVLIFTCQGCGAGSEPETTGTTDSTTKIVKADSVVKPIVDTLKTDSLNH